ncbi:Histone deacetylase 4 [Bienertia sinuspersici]
MPITRHKSPSSGPGPSPFQAKKSTINNNNDNNINNGKKLQSLVIRKEHVFGNRFYTIRTDFGGKSKLILIELNTNWVLQVKHLKWKFRGSERIKVDGYPIQLSWDVYNWLFGQDCGTHDDYALFTFRFEK